MSKPHQKPRRPGRPPLPPEERRTTRSLRLPEDTWEAIDRAAARRGETRSAWVERALRRALARAR